jgi:hypothetical protein
MIWLASSGLINIVALRLYCHLTSVPPLCVNTMYVVVAMPVIAIVTLGPVALGWLIGWGVHVVRRRVSGSAR